MPYSLAWALNDIHIANRDLHGAVWHVPETATYHVPAMCNN